MYQSSLIKDPINITREEFINTVFNIGMEYSHGYDTVVSSVILGDMFVKNSNVYTLELAHIVSVLMAKCNEDSGYLSTKKALANVGNKYIIQLEWKILKMFNYSIKFKSFINLFNELILFCSKGYKFQTLSGFFYDLSKEVCINQLLFLNPKAIIIGTVLLYKRKKLKALRMYKERIFKEIIVRICDEYDIELDLFIKTYINIKKNVTTT